MRELLCGPADFMSLKAREDYSTPEPLTRRPRPRLPWPTRQFPNSCGFLSEFSAASSSESQRRRGGTISRIPPRFLNTTAPTQPVVGRSEQPDCPRT